MSFYTFEKSNKYYILILKKNNRNFSRLSTRQQNAESYCQLSMKSLTSVLSCRPETMIRRIYCRLMLTSRRRLLRFDVDRAECTLHPSLVSPIHILICTNHVLQVLAWKMVIANKNNIFCLWWYQCKDKGKTKSDIESSALILRFLMIHHTFKIKICGIHISNSK